MWYKHTFQHVGDTTRHESVVVFGFLPQKEVARKLRLGWRLIKVEDVKKQAEEGTSNANSSDVQ